MQAAPEQRTPDAGQQGWVDRLPAVLRPYARLARLDRPIGTWLLYWPCAWGLLLPGLAIGISVHSYVYLPLFLIGALAMRSAGCVWNDIVDRDLDARVARTRDRPIASGAVSVRAALILTAGLCCIGLAVLAALPRFAQLVALAAIFLVAAYPFMKRVTWWPQAWLGLTFNWGVLVGYAAILETLTMPAIMLYAAGFFWTLGYDTIYALQDIEDDALAGIKSSARRLGSGVRAGVAIFYGLAAVLAGGAAARQGGDLTYALAAMPFTLHLIWQVTRLRGTDAAPALRLFKSNAAAGLLLAAGMAAAGIAGHAGGIAMGLTRL